MKGLILAVLSMAIIGQSGLYTNTEHEYDSTRYCGGSGFVERTETLTYASKETTSEYAMKGNVPNYSSSADATNCANVAGAELIGYYDRFYEELIPDCKTYVQIGNTVVYRSANSAIVEVMTSLKNYMGTGTGTTYNGFQKGMKKYVENHNLTYSTEDVGSLNFNKYKAAVEANKPVALFLSDYTFYLGAETNSTGETITTEYSNVAHVAVGCGYKVDTYYDNSGNSIFTRTYLKIASGFETVGFVYMCLDDYSTIDRAVAVTIS